MRSLTAPATPLAEQSVKEPNQNGIFFVAPSVGKYGCDANGEIYPFGWDSYLQTNQMPRIRRMARDGRWFFFETETENGRSFEFFGIIPDVATDASTDKIAITGKLIRIVNGKISGNVDATYYAPTCSFK